MSVQGMYSMPFDCPDAADLKNTRSLNQAFLLLLRDAGRSRQLLESLHPDLMTRLTTLSQRQIESLAAAPFLLFSISERDDRLWQSLLADRHCNDLFFAPAAGDGAGRLTAAALGFAWQLAKKNSYTARLICGASLHWCELLADQPIYQVLTAAATHNDLLKLRSASDTRLWRKLLGSGVSGNKQVRNAAHLIVLGVLTRNPQPAERDAWASAACASRQPVQRFAERPLGDN